MPNDLEAQVQLLEKQMKKLQANQQNDQLSIVVFSGDLDKVLAAMIIATGARAMDMEVKLFFTFWATTMLRDKKKTVKGKDLISKMFGMMLPKGSKQLKLSQMHMAGMGTAMIRLFGTVFLLICRGTTNIICSFFTRLSVCKPSLLPRNFLSD